MTPGEGFEYVEMEPYRPVEHVVPKFGREHDTSGEGMCWCYPTVTATVDGTFLITHSAEH